MDLKNIQIILNEIIPQVAEEISFRFRQALLKIKATNWNNGILE
jgi:hypothetical protein